MGYTASHRFARIAPRKVRPVADLIRKRPVAEALEELKFLPNRGARMLEKVIRSAMANAEDRGAPAVDRLIIVDARVDEGPRLKRIRPRARGMAFMILKRMSHIRVELEAE